MLDERSIIMEDSKQLDFRLFTDERLMNFYENCDDPVVHIVTVIELERRGIKIGS